MVASDTWYSTNRLGGLRRFAVAITLLNLLGHTVLGFEQSWAQVAFGFTVAAAYGTLLLLHVVFGLFFALTIACALRGLYLYAYALIGALTQVKVGIEEPAVGRLTS